MDNKPKKQARGTGKEMVKNAKGEIAIKAQALIGSMDTTRNLFSQMSAQYLNQKDQQLTEKSQAFIKTQTTSDTLFHQFDQETQRILHGLAKKSATTKLRSLGELKTLLQERGEDFFESFTPAFVNVYKQLAASEHERRVLEEANSALQLICERGKKSLQSKFKELFPIWFLVMNDLHSEVSGSALKAFEIGFPKEKWGQGILICQEGYLNNIRFYLKLTPKQVQQENIYLDADVADFIYERLISSTIQSISTACIWTQNTPQDKLVNFINQLMNMLGFVIIRTDDSKKKTPILLEQLDTNRKRPVIVATVLNALNYLMNYPSTRPFLLEHIEMVALKTIHLMDDPERVVQQSLWKGYMVTLLQCLPPQRILKIDFLENKLMEVTKNSGFGIGKPFYEQLTVLLAYLPQANLIMDMDTKNRDEVFRGKLQFLRRLLENILVGVGHDEARYFAEHAINCFFECLYFVCTKRIQPFFEKINEDDKNYTQLNNQVKNVLRDLLRQLLLKYLKSEQGGAYKFTPYNQFPISLAQFFEMSTPKNIIPMLELWVQELNTIFSEEALKNQVAFTNFITVVDQFLLRITQSSALFGAISNFITYMYKDTQKSLMKTIETSIINDFDLMVRLVRNLGAIWEVFSRRKERSKVLASIITDIDVNMLSGLFSSLFASVQFCTVPSKLLELTYACVQLRESAQSVFQMYGLPFENPTYDISNLNPNVQRSEQASFKLRLMVFFLCADPTTSANYYNDMMALNGVSNQEWLILERQMSQAHHERRTESQFSRELTQFTLSIKNMSVKYVIPGLVNLLHCDVSSGIQRLQSVTTELLNNPQQRALLGLYEELFFMMNWLVVRRAKLDVAIVYERLWEIVWLQFEILQSSRANRLLKIVNDFSRMKVHEIQEIQLQSAISFYRKKLLYSLNSTQESFQSFIKFSITLWDNLRLHPLHQKFSDSFVRATLDPHLYAQSLVNGNIWRMLQVVCRREPNLVHTILDEFIKSNESYELFAVFLASTSSLAVLWDHGLKRFMQNFVQNSIKPIIMKAFDEQDFNTVKLIDTLYRLSTQNSQIYGLALKQLLKQLCLEEKSMGVLCSPLMVECLQTLICKPMVEVFVNQSLQEVMVVRQLLSLLDLQNQQIRDVISVVGVADLMTSRVLDNKSDEQTFMFALDLLTTLLKQQPNLLGLEDEGKLDLVVHRLFTTDFDFNYEAMVIFEFVNLVIERKTITHFAAHIQELSSTFKRVFQSNSQKPNRFYSFAVIAALTFLRKVISFVEAFPHDFLDFVSFALYDTCLGFVSLCEESGSLAHDEQNEVMFTEFAETMLRLQQITQQDESVLLQLLRSQFISLQKAGFLGLVIIYIYIYYKKQIKNCILDQSLNDILSSTDFHAEEREQIQRAKVLALQQDEEEIDFDTIEPLSLPLSSIQLAYFLAWNIITDPRSPNVNRPPHLDTYLSNLAYLLDFLEENGVSKAIDAKDIYNGNIDLAVVHDDQSELLKLVVMGLYQVIATQQGQFKAWVDQNNDKILIKRIEEYIKTYISKAIYEREIDLIENQQLQWKTEEFEIYASRSIREITAIYTKEGQKLEIALQVPPEFPLKPLKIEVKKGVKIGEAKINKWTLMIRMVLSNENDSILNGLLLWKQNIDKQFEGMEECAVCYYIIHQTGELPKMACRTCKHKFHSFCIQKWFQSSNKSECPLCKSQFL